MGALDIIHARIEKHCALSTLSLAQQLQLLQFAALWRRAQTD
jgi:hypothetical protein